MSDGNNWLCDSPLYDNAPLLGIWFIGVEYHLYDEYVLSKSIVVFHVQKEPGVTHNASTCSPLCVYILFHFVFVFFQYLSSENTVTMYSVYIIKSASGHQTYVGMTNNFARRIRQHNGEIQGGATYTHRAVDWYPICIIDGFETMVEAMQAEWALKRRGRRRGAVGRFDRLNHILSTQSKWTSRSPDIETQHLNYYVDDAFRGSFDFDCCELYWKCHAND